MPAGSSTPASIRRTSGMRCRRCTPTTRRRCASSSSGRSPSGAPSRSSTASARASDGTYRWHLGRATPSLDSARPGGAVDRHRHRGRCPAPGRRRGALPRRRQQRPGGLVRPGQALQQVTALAVPPSPISARCTCARRGSASCISPRARELLASLEAEGPDPLDALGVGEVLSTGLTVAWSTPAITRRAAARRLGIRHLVSVPSSVAGPSWGRSPWCSIPGRGGRAADQRGAGQRPGPPGGAGGGQRPPLLPGPGRGPAPRRVPLGGEPRAAHTPHPAEPQAGDAAGSARRRPAGGLVPAARVESECHHRGAPASSG